MNSRFTIVGIGEALVDMLPQSQHVGGAPLNVAIMAHQLAASAGGRGVPVSRIGQDNLAQMILDHLASLNMDTRYIQTDPDLGTGRVYVDLDDQGTPSYDILQNVAWDVMQYDPDLEELARTCDAVCFGTLAQRHPQSRQTILRFLSEARRATRMLDVNLRGDFYDAATIARSMEYANCIKLNTDELPIVSQLLGLDDTADHDAQAARLLQSQSLKMVVLTRGREGTVIHTPQGRFEGKPATAFTPDANADSIGAGDACAAAILIGACMRKPPQAMADAANRIGAFVASQPGATPKADTDLITSLFV